MLNWFDVIWVIFSHQRLELFQFWLQNFRQYLKLITDFLKDFASINFRFKRLVNLSSKLFLECSITIEVKVGVMFASSFFLKMCTFSLKGGFVKAV